VYRSGINFRTCTGAPTKTPGAYHLGFTDDVKHFLSQLASGGEEVEKEAVSSLSDGNDIHHLVDPNSIVKQGYQKVFLVGFSLGANVSIKCLGELGEEAKVSYLLSLTCEAA
jgi:predicted alpha/beta-fold hydrolase